MTLLNWLRTRPAQPARRPRTRLSAESLEAREVPAAALSSVIGTGSAGYDAAFDVAADPAGNAYAGGAVGQKNPDGTGTGCFWAQVVKFDPTGAQSWAKTIGTTTGHEAANAVATDAAGNVFVAGEFRGTVDFDPGAGTANVTGGTVNNSFVLKLTTAGNFGWVSPFVGSGSSFANDIAVAGGSIMVGGSYSGTVDFKPGAGTYNLPAPTGSGGFLVKLNSTGGLTWAQRAGTGAVFGLTVDAAGNTYVVGGFNVSGDFDPGAGTTTLTSHGPSDIDAYVAKYSASGVYAWAESFGGVGADMTGGIAVDAGGNLTVAGYYSGTADFDPTPGGVYELPNAGATDLFLVKLRQN